VGKRKEGRKKRKKQSIIEISDYRSTRLDVPVPKIVTGQSSLFILDKNLTSQRSLHMGCDQ